MDAINKIIDSLMEILESKSIDIKTLVNTKTVLIFTTTLLTSYVYLKSTRNRYSVTPRWPPGPKPWPIIGNFFDMKPSKNKRVFEKISDLTVKYGEMLHLYAGMGMDIVVLTGADVIREAFIDHSDVFSNRPLHIQATKNMTHYHKGILFNHGPEYKVIRRFTLKTLKDFGVGKLSLESSVQEEAIHAIKLLLNNGGEAVDPKLTINKAVSNIICSLIFGERYDHDNKEFVCLLGSLDKLFNNSGSQNIAYMFLPDFIMKLFSSRIKDARASHVEIDAFITKQIEKHRQDFDVNNLRDFSDYYLKSEIDKEGIDMEDIFCLIFDLFMAGSETTTTTLRWMIVFLMRHPDIQNRCRKEIHSVIGTSRIPCWKDKGTLPYLEALILETQRHANLLPIGLGHCTATPIEFRGYLLPEKTLIMTNMTECLFNEQEFKDGKSFKPERWLNEDQTELIKNISKNFIPFGIGPRVCAGENLAKMELFLFSASFIQQMKFDVETEGVLPSTIGIHQGTLTPQPFKVRMSSCL